MYAPLPPGWEEKRAPDGRAYYVCHTTQQTSWERPAAAPAMATAVAMPLPPPPAPQLPPRAEQMPPGWEEKRAPDGRSYYVNHRTQCTQWTSPVHGSATEVPQPPQPPVAAHVYQGSAPAVAQAYQGQGAPAAVAMAYHGAPAPGAVAQVYHGAPAPGAVAQVYHGAAAPGVVAQVYHGAQAPGVVAQVYQGPPQASAAMAQVYQGQASSQGSPAPILHSGRTKALLVGCNYKGTRNALNGCVNDVQRMRTYLQGQGFAQLVVLTDDSQDRDRMPTRDNIVKGLKWLVEGAGRGDSLFFHFSGHGSQKEDISGDEADGYDETIVPCDMKQITDDELHALCIAPLPDGARLTSIMDCCHSGTGLDLPFNFTQGKGWVTDDCPAFSRGDVQLFSGCEDDACSADTFQNFKAGGAMTNAFLKALGQDPMPLYPEFMAALNRAMKSHGFKQKPQLSSSQRFGLADRIFSLTQGFVPNGNAQIGRVMQPGRAPRRRKKEKRSGMGGMMGGGMQGMMAVGMGAALMSSFF
ncbi:caspase domain-containing protein [Pelagophyceae sp. CCMP2097]|nr:caspase domain-containing protein [Pelagophyceae sp. CCMP2097]